jgi:hypothetical protein
LRPPLAFRKSQTRIGVRYPDCNSRLSAAGIPDDALLVIIELPGYRNGVPRDKVSVNFSGATIAEGKPVEDEIHTGEEVVCCVALRA